MWKRRFLQAAGRVSLLSLMIFPVAPSFAQVADAQRLLNSLGLDVAPADGVAGSRTMQAWTTFLKYRGLPDTTPLDEDGVAELGGQSGITYPQATGLEFSQVGGRFPSADAYVLDPGDPTLFSVTLKEFDYDPADYRGSTDVIEMFKEFNFRKQRAELASQNLRSDRPYTVDFEVRLSNLATGSFFQVHRGNKSGFLLGTINTGFFINAGEIIQNIVIREPELIDTWHSFRVIFYPASDGQSWFKIYVDGEQKLDTSDRNAKLPFSENSTTLHFGLYRGISATKTTADFRKLSIYTEELGAPAHDGEPKSRQFG